MRCGLHIMAGGSLTLEPTGNHGIRAEHGMITKPWVNYLSQGLGYRVKGTG